jgi:hypothetical protein
LELTNNWLLLLDQSEALRNPAVFQPLDRTASNLLFSPPCGYTTLPTWLGGYTYFPLTSGVLSPLATLQMMGATIPTSSLAISLSDLHCCFLPVALPTELLWISPQSGFEPLTHGLILQCFAVGDLIRCCFLTTRPAIRRTPYKSSGERTRIQNILLPLHIRRRSLYVPSRAVYTL